MADCSKCKNADRCEAWDVDKVRRTGECDVYEPIDNTKFDVFSELKKRAYREIKGLREASAKTDSTSEKYKYRKIRVGIEAMLEHIYEVEAEYKKQTVKTWGDRIRSMSDEELAVCFPEIINFARETEYCPGVKDWLQWLQSEAE